jgi:hypothetical protein
VSRHISIRTVCVSHVPLFSVFFFFYIFQVPQYAFLMFTVSQCFSTYVTSYSVCFSFCINFRFLSILLVFLIFQVFQCLFGFLWFFFVCVFFCVFFFFAIYQVLKCVFLIFIIFSFLAILYFLQCALLIFYVFQCFPPYCTVYKHIYSVCV